MAAHFDVERIRRDNPISGVAGAVVALVRDGREWRGLCPFHNERSPSFTVSDDKGFYHCFGCGAHGDVIDFVRDAYNVSFVEACKILGGEHEAPEAERRPVERVDGPGLYDGLKPQPCAPEATPVAGQRLRVWNPKRDRWTTYQPSMVFPYLSAEGPDGPEVLGVVLRIDLEDGRKLTPTIRWVEIEPGTVAWSHMPFDKPRPLYGPIGSGQVIVVEGEKAADAARRVLGMAVTTWPGGTQGVKYADWAALAGRSVVLWGDADEPGETAMQEVAGLLAAQGCHVKLVPWDRSRPKGWDAADAEADGMSRAGLLAWIKSRAVEYGAMVGPSPADSAAASVGVGPQMTASARPGPDDQPPNNDDAPPIDAPGASWEPDYEPYQTPTNASLPFRVLGHNHDDHYYYSEAKQQLVTLTAGGHTPNNLLRLAPLDFWSTWYPAKGELSFSVTQAVNQLIKASHARGVFSPKNIRGRGAWLDDGRPVMHLGETVYFGGVEMRPSEIKGRYTYEAAPPLDMEPCEPATTTEAHWLVDICGRLSWENPLSGKLLAGWCVIAPVCGALTWRPHIWITGSSGAGKSTVLAGVVERIVGPIAERFEGGTTEAGLRQTMGHDARPIIIDEIEAEGQQAAQNVARVLALARIASSGGKIAKGTTGGQAVEHAVRACFCFSSINTSIKERADARRISKLVLMKHKDGNEDEYLAIMRDITARFTPDYAARMFARTIAHMPVLLKNIKMFTDAAASLMERTAADQIGAMLAGLYLCHSTREIEFDHAVEWVKKHTWDDHTATGGDQDETRLLSYIASTVRRITTATGIKEFTIGEMLAMLATPALSPLSSEDIMRDLGRVGIKYHNDGFIIASVSPTLAKILDGQPWARDWTRPLRAIEGARPFKNQYFSPGLKSRGTWLPMEAIAERPDGELPFEREYEPGAYDDAV